MALLTKKGGRIPVSPLSLGIPYMEAEIPLFGRSLSSHKENPKPSEWPIIISGSYLCENIVDKNDSQINSQFGLICHTFIEIQGNIKLWILQQYIVAILLVIVMFSYGPNRIFVLGRVRVRVETVIMNA